MILLFFSCGFNKEKREEARNANEKHKVESVDKNKNEKKLKVDSNPRIKFKRKRITQKCPITAFELCNEYKNRGDSIRKIFIDYWCKNSTTRTNAYLKSKSTDIQLMYDFFEFYYNSILYKNDSAYHKKINKLKFHVVQSYITCKTLDFDKIKYSKKQTTSMFTVMCNLYKDKMDTIKDFFPEIEINCKILYYGNEIKTIVDEFVSGNSCSNYAYYSMGKRLENINKMSYLAKDDFDARIFEIYPFIGYMFIDKSLKKVYIGSHYGCISAETLFEKINDKWVENMSFSLKRLE